MTKRLLALVLLALASSLSCVDALVGPDAQSRLVLESGGGQTARIQSALADSIVVKALSPESAVLPNVAITFVTTSGTVSPVTVTTNAQGLAKVRWTMGNTAGTVTLTASATGAIPVSVTATALADTRRILTLVSGSGQDSTVGAFLRSVVQVKVTDSLNNPIAGETIQWRDSTSNGVLPVFTTSQTDVNGLASTTVRLGFRVGPTVMRARLASRSETVTANFNTQVALAGIQSGNFFSCATTSDGRAYCWGYNRDGQLAKSTTMRDDVDRPSTPITAADSLQGPFENFRQISLGRTHSCGVSLARKLICWGTGSGAFGAKTPTEVNLDNTTVESVATGEAHSCYVDIDGFARCAGENALGQLGNNSTTSTSGNAAVTVLDASLAPLRFSSLGGGRSFTCGFRRIDPLDLTSRVPYCWGDNASGQLGRNSTIGSSVAAAVTIPGGFPTTFDSTSLAIGLDHACVLSDAGAAYCWGSNGYGQLGNNGTTGSGQRQLQMVAVSMPAGQTFVKLAAGEYHTCGITSVGAVYCWGRNSSGQIGDGTQVLRAIPTQVLFPPGVTAFRAISLGELHSCAITGTPTVPPGPETTTAIGAVYCWGDNEYGQIGDGSNSGNASPVLTPKRVLYQP